MTLLLAAGALIGWLYGRPLLGLAVAALAALVWQLRQLLSFDKALNTGDFSSFRHGEGIWQKIYSRLSYEHDRAERHKREYRRLLKEIRKSTNAMPDGAVILDNANEIVVCNRAAKNLAGLKRKKDRGQRVDNRPYGQLWERVGEAIAAALSAKRHDLLALAEVLRAPPPQRVAVPETLAAHTIESACAADYDALLSAEVVS